MKSEQIERIEEARLVLTVFAALAKTEKEQENFRRALEKLNEQYPPCESRRLP